MRLNNNRYNYRFPKLTLKIFFERRFQYYVRFTNHTQYRARARAREHNNTMGKCILNFTHLFNVHEHWKCTYTYLY